MDLSVQHDSTEQNGANDRSGQPWQRWLPLLLLTLLLGAFYLVTLQDIVNGSDHDYTLDTGEIQVALNTAGTIHYTGYPLYTMLSTLVTLAVRAMGVSPAAAASFSSLLWSLLALLLIYHLLLHMTDGAHLLAAGGVLLLGATESVWLHSIIAEVYSFSLLLTVAVLLLALRLAQKPEHGTWFLLLLAWGAAVAHHRSLLLLFPVLLLPAPVVVPQLRRRPLWLLSGLLAFLLPFTTYLYLPWRAWQGAGWVYGAPDTWQGFWRQFTGSEVTGGLLRLPSPDELGPNARFLSDHLRRQLPLPLLAAALAGLLWYARSHPWRTGGLLGTVLLLCTFVFLFPPAVWAPAVLLPVILALVAGLVLLARALTRGSRSRAVLAALFLVAALLLARQNWPFVHELTTDPTGTELTASLERLERAYGQEPGATVAIPWGTHYFAAVFGQRVAERVPEELQLVDHRADFGQLACTERPLLTPVFTHNYWPLEWWQEQLGPVRLDEVAAGFVKVCPSQQVQDSAPAGQPFATGVGINLWADVAVGSDEALLTLWWQPEGTVTADYSVAVHLVAHDPPQGPADLLTQADAIHPIDGWYPTSRWQPGEVIRDVYRIPIAPGQTPAALRVALYRQNEMGEFVNSEWLSLPLR